MFHYMSSDLPVSCWTSVVCHVPKPGTTTDRHSEIKRGLRSAAHVAY